MDLQWMLEKYVHVMLYTQMSILDMSIYCTEKFLI